VGVIDQLVSVVGSDMVSEVTELKEGPLDIGGLLGVGATAS
jgi:hypothetical protein